MRYALLFLLLLPVTQAALIEGSVYDFSLERVDNVKVEINTTPQQRDITEDGRYAFSVTPGQYMLRAEQISEGVLLAMAQEEVQVDDEGNYIVDIILFPELDEPVSFPRLDIAVEEEEPLDGVLVLVSILIVLGVISYLYARSRREVQSTTSEGDALLAYLLKEGGRATQKELRKAFPHSEAKMSLLLSELEDAGKIKKIKKGRGNIIVKV